MEQERQQRHDDDAAAEPGQRTQQSGKTEPPAMSSASVSVVIAREMSPRRSVATYAKRPLRAGPHFALSIDVESLRKPRTAVKEINEA